MSRWIGVAVLLTAGALGASLYIYRFEYDRLPAEVPVHWNIQGKPDNFWPKEQVWKVFFLVPGIMVGMIGLAFLLPWLSPKSFEVDTFRSTFFYIMTLVVALLGFIHVAVLWASLRGDLGLDLGRWIVAGVLFFLVLTGNQLGRVRRNFWMGVRTPWTLASDTVWIQTHRLAAWLFVGGGLVGLIAVALGIPLEWCFGLIMAVAFIPVIYSLILYKRLQGQGKV
jgi:uncharacterized membrane protein